MTVEKKRIFNLFMISFNSLFLEVMLIRWLAANIRLLAYFTNITLIASFLGLSMGCLLGRKKRDLLPFWPGFFTLLMGACWYFGQSNIQSDLRGQALWHVLQSTGSNWPVSVVIVIFFILVLGSFIPMGQRLGRDLEYLPPILAYSVNVGGSLAGVIVFAGFSYFAFSSYVWFGIFLAGMFLLQKPWKFFRLSLIGASAVTMFIVYQLDAGAIRWSPYHKIQVTPIEIQGVSKERIGYQLFINRDFYQFIVNLIPGINSDPYWTMLRDLYETPYKFTGCDKAMIIGAGTGNDVSAALRTGVKHVDAIDIDPVILELGAELHPEKPYDDPRVTRHCMDARVFLRNSKSLYDVITIGFLDSQTLFSRMSNIRLDSFVYTKEAFEDIRKNLEPDGILACCFAVPRPWIAYRLQKLITTIFGVEPQVFRGTLDDLFLLAVRKDGQPLKLPPNSSLVPTHLLMEDVVLTTDNWPFFYMETNHLSTDYLQTLGILLGLCILFVLLIMDRSRIGNPSMFFLGTGFLLLETLSITKLSLLYGATWIVSSTVIAFFLTAILLANLFTAKFSPQKLHAYYLMLFTMLCVNAFVPVKFFLLFDIPLRICLSTVMFCLPVFFAGIIFAVKFKRSEDIQIAFGMNTMGAVLGGFLEYMSLEFGFQALYIVIFIAYLLSMFSFRRSRG